MTSFEKNSKKTRLLIILAGAVLMSMVLAFSAAPAARADSTTPNLLGVTKIAPPLAHETTGQFVAQPTNAIAMHVYGQTSYKGGPVPNDAPFGPNQRVTVDPNVDSRPSIVVQPGTGYLWVAYQNFNGADWDVVLDVSTDDGATWNNVLATIGTGNEINPSLAVTSSSAFVLTWQDDADTNVMPFAHSFDAGATWLAYTLNINAVIPELTLIEFPSVVAQRTPGAYPDGIMFQMGAWCSSVTNCDSGSHNVFWVGEQNMNQADSGWSFGLGGYYWLTSAAPGGPNFVIDPLHPAAWWGSADYSQVMDMEETDGTEWVLLWIFLSEDGVTPINGYTSTAISNDGLYGAGGENGMNAVVAGTFRLASAPTRHQIIYFYTSDGWTGVGGDALDAAVTDQRAVSVAAPPGAMTDFHITYYSDLEMTDAVVDTAGTPPVQQRVSDNTPATAVNDDRASSVYIDSGGAPKVAWQDNRGANTDIYVTGYVGRTVWINSTCGGVDTPLSLLVDGGPITTPWTAKWADGTSHIIQAAPATQIVSTCKRCIFWQWEDGTTTNPRTVVADQNLAIEARYNDQYQVNFLTNPPGLDVIVKGVLHTTPYSYWESPGINYPAEAPTPQPGAIPADEQYVFDNWDDGVTTAVRTYDVAAPNCTNLTANFHTQYRITIDALPSGQGLMVGYDATPMATAPVTFWADPASTHMLITFSPQAGVTDTRYKFNRWAAPGPATWGYNITVSGAANYIAQFDAQYKITILSNIVGPMLNINIGECTPIPPGLGPMYCWELANSNPSIILSTPQNPNLGSRFTFTGWDDGNLNPTRAIGPVTQPWVYTSMWTAEYFLTMTLGPNCGGTLTPTNAWYPRDTPVNIDWTSPAVVTGERWRFIQWQGAGTGNYTGPNQASLVRMYDAITQTALCIHEYQVTINTVPDNRQIVVDDIARTSPFAPWWASLSQHYINVTTTMQYDVVNPETRYVFTDWDGNPNPNQLIYTVTDPDTMTANFRTQHHITLTQNPATPAGLGGLQCLVNADCWFDQLTNPQVSLTSPYPAGALYIRYNFQSWSGDANGNAQSFTFTSIAAPKNATANWVVWYKVTVTTAWSTATCAPNADCWFASGTVATLSVTSPTPGATGTRYVFTSWTGATGTLPTAGTVTVDSPKNVTANWKTQYELTIVSNCGNNVDCGLPTGEGWFDADLDATISVTTPYTDPNGKIWDFTAWTGASTATTAATTATMDAAKTATATWTERVITKDQASDVWLWVIIIVIIAVVVALALFFLMKRKKPAPQEEELPPEEVPPAPPGTMSGGPGGVPPRPKK